jgi:cytosine/adenosine deaminase-related metal-dependent hydrolase
VSPAAIVRAVEEMRLTGTVVVGDISNTLTTTAAITAGGLAGIVFHELIGFQAPDPEAAVAEAWARADAAGEQGTRNRTRNDEPARGTRNQEPGTGFSVVAHAPYSVSKALFRAIVAARRAAPLSVHVGESPEEIEFLANGTGPIRRLLEEIGVWTDAWEVPRCDPVEYLSRLGYLQPGCLVVHGVHLTDAALERLRQAEAVLVTCPRSNVWVGSGSAPVSRFYRAGLRVAIGTDSLASTDSLNMFDELAAARRAAPDVAASRLLESATRIGAEALGFGGDFGTIAPGTRAALVAVEIPAGVTDVEEYLVSGVPASRVSRVTPSGP